MKYKYAARNIKLASLTTFFYLRVLLSGVADPGGAGAFPFL